MKKIIIITIAFMPCMASAQTHAQKLDSMLRISATAKQDTNLARLYFDIGEMILLHDLPKAKEYYFKTKTLSDRLDWNEGRYLYLVGFADVVRKTGQKDSAIFFLQKALDLAKKEGNETWTVKMLGNLGILYYTLSWYETALSYFNEALPIFEKRGEKFRMAHYYNMMGNIFNSMSQYKESSEYFEKALNIWSEKPDTLLRASCLSSYVITLYTTNQFEKARQYAMEAERIFLIINSKNDLGIIYNRLAYIAFLQHDLAKMEIYTRKVSEVLLGYDDITSLSFLNRNYARLEWYRKNFDKAEEYAEIALTNAIKNKSRSAEKLTYTLLADISNARHDFRNVTRYKAKADSVENMIVTEKTIIYAKELEAKYETEKKETAIASLETENRLLASEKRLMMWLGIVLTVLLAVLFFTFLINRKLAKERIKRLEEQHKLLLAEAELEGELAERRRIARDLHDGLGGMLASVKVNMQNAKPEISGEIEYYGKAAVLLDDAMKELRRLAHHLMPEALERCGLKTSLEVFCQSIPNAQFHFFGNDKRIDSKLEMMIYRSAHELINNVIKHAQATQINVQLVQEPDRLSLTVQDNGCGFDPSHKTDGMGLNNIRTRTALFNGEFHIFSEPGKGTESSLELTIDN